MRIAIDISQIVHEGTGVARYTRELVNHLPQVDLANEYFFFGTSLRRQQTLRAFTPRVFPIPPTVLEILWNRLHVFPIETLIGKIDLLHSSDWTQPPTKAKKVTTIHDLVVYKYPETLHPSIVAAQKRRLDWVVKECDLIIVDSQATKNDCQAILGIEASRLRVVYPGVGENFTPASPSQIVKIRDKYRLPKDYFLAVGTREPRKNLARVVAAAEKIGATLAIAGKSGWGAETTGAKILGFVPDADMAPLYSGAKAFVYPSLYEGFGFPILEAMACGCPVITSNAGSLPEVGGDAAFYVDPENVTDIGEKMAGVSNHLVKKGLARVKKFTWEETASKTVKVYEELAT